METAQTTARLLPGTLSNKLKRWWRATRPRRFRKAYGRTVGPECPLPRPIWLSERQLSEIQQRPECPTWGANLPSLRTELIVRFGLPNRVRGQSAEW